MLGKQGRLVIPADIRTALRLDAGDQLELQVEGQHLILMSAAAAADELLGFAKNAASSRSLVAELLAERRAQAAAE